MGNGVRRFEELIAWQKAREMTSAIYAATLTERFVRDFGLRNQITRAAGSVMSNIAEGFERGGRTEFHHYLVIAKASCAEVRSDLYIASDAGYLDDDAFQALMAKANEAARYVNALRTAVAKQRDADAKRPVRRPPVRD
jgi:four helix bundle protein